MGLFSKLKDPVCGMTVTKDLAGHHGGKTYYFCSASCKTKFEADPRAYV